MQLVQCKVIIGITIRKKRVPVRRETMFIRKDGFNSEKGM